MLQTFKEKDCLLTDPNFGFKYVKFIYNPENYCFFKKIAEFDVEFENKFVPSIIKKSNSIILTA